MMTVTLLRYAYCAGKVSWHRNERVADEELPYRVLAYDERPDPDASCRQRDLRVL